MPNGSVTSSLSFNGRFIKSLNRRLSLQHAQDSHDTVYEHDHAQTLTHASDQPARPTRPSSTRLIKPRPRPSHKSCSANSDSLLSSIASDDIPSRPLSLPPGPWSSPPQPTNMSADRLRNVVKRTSMLFDRSNNDTQEIDINAAIAVLHELKKNATPGELAVLQQALLAADPEIEPNAEQPPFHRRDSFKTPGRASRAPLVAAKRPSRETIETSRRDRPHSHSISVPVKFAKGAEKVAHKYSTSLATNPRLSRSFTPADLEKESLGSYKLGTLRVTNGALSPNPGMSNLLDEESDFSVSDLAESYATECGFNSDLDTIDRPSPTEPTSSPVPIQSFGPSHALRILDGHVDQPLCSSASDSVHSQHTWSHDTHSKCDSGYGSEGHIASPTMEEHSAEHAAPAHDSFIQPPARRVPDQFEHCRSMPLSESQVVSRPRQAVSSFDHNRSYALPSPAPAPPTLVAPSPEKKVHQKRLYKARPAPRKPNKSSDSVSTDVRSESMMDIPRIPDELSTNFSRRINRVPTAWPQGHVFTSDEPASPVRGRAAVGLRDTPVLEQHPSAVAGLTTPDEDDVEATPRKSFFRLRGRTRSKSMGRPEVTLPRDKRTVAETIDQSPTASPHLASSEWVHRPVASSIDQRSPRSQETPRKMAMSDEEARQLARKRSKDYLPARSRSRPRVDLAEERGPVPRVIRQRSKSMSQRTERARTDIFEHDVPPVPQLPKCQRQQAWANYNHVSPLGSNPRQRSRTIAIDATVSPAIIISRYVTPTTLDLSAPVGSANKHRRRADSVESGKASRAQALALNELRDGVAVTTPRSLVPGCKRSILPAFEIQSSSPDVLVDRYSGGLGYGWERGRGYHGSAGTRHTDNVHKSVALRGKYGVDLTDVPVFLTAA